MPQVCGADWPNAMPGILRIPAAQGTRWGDGWKDDCVTAKLIPKMAILKTRNVSSSSVFLLWDTDRWQRPFLTHPARGSSGSVVLSGAFLAPFGVTFPLGRKGHCTFSRWWNISILLGVNSCRIGIPPSMRHFWGETNYMIHTVQWVFKIGFMLSF